MSASLISASELKIPRIRAAAAIEETVCSCLGRRGEVLLDYVPDFVRHHPEQLAFAIDEFDQAAVDEDHVSPHRERVHRRIVDDEDRNSFRRLESFEQPLDVQFRHRVVKQPVAEVVPGQIALEYLQLLVGQQVELVVALADRRYRTQGQRQRQQRPGAGAGGLAYTCGCMPEKELAHLGDAGAPRMVEVGHKEATVRQATAAGSMRVSPEVMDAVESSKGRKGSVVAVATIAAIQAAKRTPDFIPLCHPVQISGIDVDFELDRENLQVRCTAAVRCTGRTGVEMEALLAVHAGLLTVYDMCKSIDRGMEVVSVRLLSKSGGRRGDYTASD